MPGRPASPVSLADWLRDAPRPWPAVETLHDGDLHVACYYVDSVELLHTRQEKPYLRLRLCDRHGSIDGRVWDDAEAVLERVEKESYVGVRGRVQVYQGRHQLKIEAIAPVQVAPEELDLFLARSRRDPAEMDRELEIVLESVQDPPLRALLRRLLDTGTEVGRLFRQAPAAKMNHHAYVGGLLEHTLSMVRVCDLLARHYGSVVDRDLLVAGALVHDIGKVRELAVQPGFPYTTEGKLLGHILLGLQLVGDEGRRTEGLTEDRLNLLLHLVASHQGRYEWQSPREPRVLEAILLHYADDVDAKMTQAMALVGSVTDGWTVYDRSLARDFFRHLGSRPDDETGRAPVSRTAAAAEAEQDEPEGPADAEERIRTLDLFQAPD